MTASALALGAALLAAPSSAAPAAPQGRARLTPEAVMEISGDLSRLARDPHTNPLTLPPPAARAFGESSSGGVLFDARGMRPWDFPRAEDVGDGAPISMEAYRARAARILRVSEPPAPDLERSLALALGFAPSRLYFESDGVMDDGQAGEFLYSSGRSASAIRIHPVMSFVAGMSLPFALATLAHEAGHAYDHARGRLSPGATLKGEESAFRNTYLWLLLVDPYGERLTYLRTAVKRRLRADPRPNPVLAAADRYFDHLAALREAVETDTLEEFVRELYGNEPHGHAPRGRTRT